MIKNRNEILSLRLLKMEVISIFHYENLNQSFLLKREREFIQDKSQRSNTISEKIIFEKQKSDSKQLFPFVSMA